MAARCRLWCQDRWADCPSAWLKVADHIPRAEICKAKKPLIVLYFL
jgi:hypothetical protein